MFRRATCAASCALAAGVQIGTERFVGQDFIVRRNVSFLEPGARTKLDIAEGCRAQDQHGAIDCSLAWASKNRIYYDLHLPDGVHPGDTLALSLKTDIISKNAGDNGLADVFSGDEINMKGTCGICEGSCTLSGNKASIVKFSLTCPTILDQKEMCAGLKNSSDLVLWNEPGIPEGPFGKEYHILYMQMSGKAETTMQILGKDGALRFEDRFQYTFPEQLNSPKFHRAHSLLQRDQAVRAKSRTQTVSLLGAARMGAEAAVSNALRAVAGPKSPKNKAAAKSKPKAGANTGSLRKIQNPNVAPGAGLAGLWARLKVWMMEDRNNTISLTAGDHCMNTDDLGSVDCRVSWKSIVNLGLNFKLSGVLEENATIDFKFEPKVDGMLKMVAGALLKPVKFSLPLCGQPHTISFGGKSITATPPKCGFWALNLEAPSFVFQIPDLKDKPIVWPKELANVPFLPSKITGLPPMGLTSTATIKHPDGSPMVSLTLDLGVE